MAQKIRDIRENLIKMGNLAKKKYEESGDLGAAKTAIHAFAIATKTSLVQVQYKKLTGVPSRIEFLEE